MKIKIYITFTSSNIHVNITNCKSCTLFHKTCFSKKATFFSITFYENLLQSVFDFLKIYKQIDFIIIISGFNVKRFTFLKDFFSLDIFGASRTQLFFVCIKPFNGCRLKKQRRLLFLPKVGV